MQTLRIPESSREYLYLSGLKFFNPDSPDSQTDPSNLTVLVAAVPAGNDPTDTTSFVAAEWVSNAINSLRILLGPGGDLPLLAGYYDIWLRVDGSIERPERPVIRLQVT